MTRIHFEKLARFGLYSILIFKRFSALNTFHYFETTCSKNYCPFWIFGVFFCQLFSLISFLWGFFIRLVWVYLVSKLQVSTTLITTCFRVMDYDRFVLPASLSGIVAEEFLFYWRVSLTLMQLFFNSSSEKRGVYRTEKGSRHFLVSKLLLMYFYYIFFLEAAVSTEPREHDFCVTDVFLFRIRIHV